MATDAMLSVEDVDVDEDCGPPVVLSKDIELKSEAPYNVVIVTPRTTRINYQEEYQNDPLGDVRVGQDLESTLNHSCSVIQMTQSMTMN